MKKDILKIILSVITTIVGLLFFSNLKTIQLILLIISYIIIAYDIVFKAVRNIIHGDIFNENFLMTIASIGAFLIGEHSEGIAVMVFYQIGELFQMRAVDKSRKSISSLMEICPDKGTVLREGEYLTIDAEEICVGETIVIKPGERIPLDCKIINGKTSIDTSPITGESVPKRASTGDEILSGCINESAVITAEVTKEFSESTASKILELVENASSRKSKSEKFITRFARYYTPIVVLSALFIAIIPPLFSNTFTYTKQLYIALSFLVASCPCALVISVPLAFFGGLGKSAKDGILIKGSNYLEALAHTEIAIFDKTGTLTKGVFEVDKICPENISQDELLKIAAHCEYFSQHPIALSIKRAYNKQINENLINSMEEIPSHGICAEFSGEKYYAGNLRLMKRVGINISDSDANGTVIYFSRENEYLGYIIISDQIKGDSKKAICDLKKSGVKKTIMLTGDTLKNAQHISEQLGIDEVFADLLPIDKLKIAEQLISQTTKNGKVVFVGDGINDTPVLARADVGIAMGALGTDAAIESADIVIMTDEPSKLSHAINLSKYTLSIVKQNIIFSLFIKISVLILCALSVTSMWAAVFADVGVSVLAILNSIRILKKL